jgi:hypothetical protein
MATGTVRGRRLPIPLAQLQSTPAVIGSRYFVWISEKERLMAFDLSQGRMWTLARAAQYAPFFLRDGLVAWQRIEDGSMHAFDLKTGHRIVVRQAWCAEPAICRLAGIAPGGMVALDVQHLDPSDAHAVREELFLEKLR